MWGWIKLVWQGGCGLYTVYTYNSKNNLQSLGCGLYMVAAYTQGVTVIFYHLMSYGLFLLCSCLVFGVLAWVYKHLVINKFSKRNSNHCFLAISYHFLPL